jgi:ankyrin repeat protein
MPVTQVLLKDYKINPNVQDYDGDTALHDAARFGHVKVGQTGVRV